MEGIEVALLLVAALCALTLLSRRLTVLPPPALLVLGGALLAVVPGVPAVEVDPDVVLLLFLPPLLFFPAVTGAVREMRRNLRAILLLAVGLVLTTVCAVAVLAHALVPGLPWAVAFALGAIVSPPDALAVTALGRRLQLPARVVAILEGESLINDATALILYRVAVAAAVTGEFSVGRSALELVLGAAGAVLIGLAGGALLAFSGSRLSGDPPLENTLFLLLPYAVYLASETVHVSGVLAVVVAGLYTARRTSSAVSSATRLQGFAVVELVTFLLSGLAFLLVGLQVPSVVEGLGDRSLASAVALGVAVTTLLIALRVVWVFVGAYLPRLLSARIRTREPSPSARSVALVGYLGLRGVVSLAAALALPSEVDGGGAFPERDLLQVVVVTVILLTLVGQGSATPLLVRALRVEDAQEQEREREVAVARRDVASAALDRLDELAEQDWVREDTAERVRGLYDYRRQRYVTRLSEDDETHVEQRASDYLRLMHELIAAQRRAVHDLRTRGDIDDEALRSIERELDLEESRLSQ